MFIVVVSIYDARITYISILFYFYIKIFTLYIRLILPLFLVVLSISLAVKTKGARPTKPIHLKLNIIINFDQKKRKPT